MPRPGPATLAALQTLFETKRGRMLPLPPRLARLYSRLRMPLPRDPLFGTLIDVRRGGSHLFLRYSFP